MNNEQHGSRLVSTCGRLGADSVMFLERLQEFFQQSVRAFFVPLYQHLFTNLTPIPRVGSNHKHASQHSPGALPKSIRRANFVSRCAMVSLWKEERVACALIQSTNGIRKGSGLSQKYSIVRIEHRGLLAYPLRFPVQVRFREFTPPRSSNLLSDRQGYRKFRLC